MKHTQKTRLTVITIAMFALVAILGTMLLSGLSLLLYVFWQPDPILVFGSAITLALVVSGFITYKIMATYKKAKENNKFIRIIAELIEAILFAW